MEVGVVINRDTIIEDVVVVSERETRSFFNRLLKNDFFEQFKGLSISNRFETGETIDGLSGATVSSVAFTRAIRKAAHQYAKNEYNLTALSPAPVLKFGIGEIAVLALLIWSAALYFKKNKIMQHMMHLSALVLIGFYLNLSISITNFGSVLQGYFPNIYDHLVWYILTIGVLLVAIIFGRNIYCYRICPFYAVQWLANKISGINLNPDNRIGRFAKYMAGVLLWASLLTGFLKATPSSGSYEPFATIFSFEGEGVQWFILPAVFFSAFFIKDVFCRYYCPVGNFLKFLIIRVRKPLFKQLRIWENVSKVKRAIS
ncbi:MAG: 4Fe-4S binding protein [Cytophagales bacterium]|nr:4Fe-4S binding protein [Cytophagales bacterium]